MERTLRHRDERTPVTYATPALKELAHRAHDGLEVTLLWNPRSDEVSIDVVDERHNSSFLLAVDPASALDAFNHPYVYAPPWIELPWTTEREAVVAEG
jgi:hypothetical protein